MATQERINQIGITLSLIALCLPLFVNYHVKAKNSCPYETYIRVDQKCVDISAQGLGEITAKLDRIDQNGVEEVTQEIAEVSNELEDLSQELEEYCLKEQPITDYQVEIMSDVCQY